MRQLSATSWVWGLCRRGLPLVLLLAAGAAVAGEEVPGEVLAGTRLKSGPSPLPELTPFQARGGSVAPAVAADQPLEPGDAGAALPLTPAEMLLAGAGIVAFLALRYRR